MNYSITLVYSLDASIIIIVGFVYSCCGAQVRRFLWRRKLALIMFFVVGHVTAVALYSSANGVVVMDQGDHRVVSLHKVSKITEEPGTSLNDSIIVKSPQK